MATIYNWIESEDCVLVDSESNGFGRGDGCDVDYYRSVRTGRYIARVYDIRNRSSDWYVASTEEAILAVGADGWTPGAAPGAYRAVSAPNRLREVRLADVEVMS